MTGVLAELSLGRVRWDLLHPFPQQDPGDRAAGDTVVAELDELLRRCVDADEVDRTGCLPDGVVQTLADRGFLALCADPAIGGRALSPMNAFRVVVTAAAHSGAVGMTMGVGNGLGSPAYLPILPDGPLRDLITARAPGLVSGGADTEPAGAGNLLRTTTATPIEGGRAYSLTGEKIFIGNAPVAGLMDVSATVRGAGEPWVGLFFVDLSGPGVERGPRHEFLGMRGSPNGVLRLRDVRVPRELMLGGGTPDWRQIPALDALMALARMYIIAAPALAAVRLCLDWSLRFAAARSADGRRLRDYDQIRSLLAATAADHYALTALVDWCLLGGERVSTVPEQSAAKNATSRMAWRVVDRTVSLLGAAGLETATSKSRRGTDPVPLERVLRDVRCLRVAGGVDFQVDFWAAHNGLFARHRDPSATVAAVPEVVGSVPEGVAARHLSYTAQQAHRWAHAIATHVRDHPDPSAPSRVPIAMNQIGTELLTAVAVVARAARDDTPVSTDLSEVYCAGARHRIAALWHSLHDDGPHGRLVDRLYAR
jgi:alkylation response protein AidB-like acyl-CoA dehydrogenase